MSDLWTDLEAESRKPGPTMTITKAQYLALREAADTSRVPLEVAWAEAEAALPEGWGLELASLALPGWAEAVAVAPQRDTDHDVTEQAESPAAALHALAARLVSDTTAQEEPQ